MKNTLITGIADILAGLAALAFFVFADNFLHLGADFRIAVLLFALLFLGAGLLRGRGRPESAWLKGLLIGSVGSLLLVILGRDEIHPIILAILLLTANLFAVVGVRVRRLWAARSAAAAAATALLPFAALVIAAITTIPALTTRIAIRKTSVPAPAFSINTLEGTVVRSDDLRGRVVVMDFWATWCLPCRREMPEVEKLYRRYQGNPKVSIWAVDVQKDGETPDKAREFMQKGGYTLPVACAGEDSLGGLSAGGFPTLVIIDKSGQKRLVHSGYDGSERLEDELSKEIDALLAE